MLRLYAVPSEKLRVWMVWLTSVAEITDEWHKWLRAHIDLIARIAERLQMAADHVPGGRRIESTVSSDAILSIFERDVSHQCYILRQLNSPRNIRSALSLDNFKVSLIN